MLVKIIRIQSWLQYMPGVKKCATTFLLMLTNITSCNYILSKKHSLVEFKQYLKKKTWKFAYYTLMSDQHTWNNFKWCLKIVCLYLSKC